MREREIEKHLINEVKRCGGLCEKWISGTAGWPDRLVLLPDGVCAFVEVKAPNKKPRPLQKARHRLLQKLGFKVYVLDDAEQIGGIIDEIRTA